MASFDYRLNPLYPIKECSFGGALYTTDYCCSDGSLGDKIICDLVKTPDLFQEPPLNCPNYGNPVDGHYCQGCTLLPKKFKEDLFRYCIENRILQDSFEPSNDNTNIFNALQEPFVVKQDPGETSSQSPPQINHHCCYGCGDPLEDVLRYGEACKRCTCAKCGSGLGKGLCYICGHNQNSLNDSPSISETSSQSPPNINHCCYECGDPLDGIFCKRCICKSCGKDAHIGYNCPSTVSVISNPEPCNSQTIDELPQTLLIFHPTFHSDAESPFPLDLTPTYVDESPNLNSTLAKIKDQMKSITSLCEMACHVVQKKLEEKQLEEERAAKAKYWKLPVCYDDDDDEERSDFLSDNIISGLPPFSAITPDEPVLSTEEPDHSLSMGDEHLDTIPATESEELIKSGVENLIPIPNKIDYVEASPPDSELVSSEVMEIVISEVGGIKASNDNPIPFHDPIISRNPSNLTPSGESDFFLETKSSSTSLNSLLEETNNFNNSLPEFTTFSNVPFDAKYESDSSDDQSCSDEDVLEKIVSKPLSEEEIIPLKSLRTHDSSLPISSKIDSLLDEFVDEFAGELTLLKSIPLGIDKTDCDFEEDIRLIKKLLYDNSSSHQFEDLSESNEEFSSTDDDSFSLDNIDYVEASPLDSELVSSEGDMLLLEAFLNDDHSFDFKTKSSSTSLNSLLEETNNFDNSLPEFTTFSNDPFDAKYEYDSKEFASELTLLKLIPPGIDETDCDFEEDIHLIEKLLYDNSSPRPPEEFVSANSDAEIKSFSSPPILVKDSDFLMEEIDLLCTPDYPMPPESFHFDIPPFSRPPAKPPDGDTGILNIKMMGDISD
nr:hypothetical protein [Tanacetum cinerariifolium]